MCPTESFTVTPVKSALGSAFTVIVIVSDTGADVCPLSTYNLHVYVYVQSECWQR